MIVFNNQKSTQTEQTSACIRGKCWLEIYYLLLAICGLPRISLYVCGVLPDPNVQMQTFHFFRYVLLHHLPEMQNTETAWRSNWRKAEGERFSLNMLFCQEFDCIHPIKKKVFYISGDIIGLLSFLFSCWIFHFSFFDFVCSECSKISLTTSYTQHDNRSVTYLETLYSTLLSNLPRDRFYKRRSKICCYLLFFLNFGMASHCFGKCKCIFIIQSPRSWDQSSESLWRPWPSLNLLRIAG